MRFFYFFISFIPGSKVKQTTESTLTTTPTAKTGPPTAPCSMKGGVFDKLTGITYIFNGNKLYKTDEHLKNTDGPFNVSQILPDVKSVDAAYVNSRSEVVFFNGTRLERQIFIRNQVFLKAKFKKAFLRN